MKRVFLFITLFFIFPCYGYTSDNTTRLDEIVISATREAELQKDVPQTINVVKEGEIKSVKPSHPQEIMDRIPGVWVGVTAGEGHMTAIRQPLTTNPVYLYLEDGIPIRSTGFFNHNALYEMNIPQAERIEVMKGPATALYGSDAIGGTINVITKRPSLTPDVELNTEAGSFGWYRFLGSASNTFGTDGLRFDLNISHKDGFRDRTGYDRQSASLRYDKTIGASVSLKTVISFHDIDQKTGGTSTLTKTDYENRPSYNYQTFDFRKVKAFRYSTDIGIELNKDSVLSFIPYVRYNRMDLLPGWGIFKSGTKYYGYDSTTEFYSLGLMSKYRVDLPTLKTRLITGVDIDYSPGSYYERRIQAFKTGDQYTSYTYVTDTTNNYDFNAIFTGVSPYIQTETTPVEKLKITAGARYDILSYDYTTNLAANANRPDDTDRSFSHLSPKIGLTYDFLKELNAFVSYKNTFRAPSATDLFKGSSGTASTAVSLKPIKADSFEAGLRGNAGDIFTYDATLYYMEKRDDIVNYSPITNVTLRQNAGKTTHEGVEIGFGVKPLRELELSTSYSYAEHKYDEYVVSKTLNYNGNEIPLAPRTIVNTRLMYRPCFLNGGGFELEWVKLGDYWMDNENTAKYSGHDLFNFRANYKINKNWTLYARVLNIFDKLYAEQASKSGTDQPYYAPGEPRTFFAGLTYNFGGGK
ncbi:TonB-dependent receptor [Candidatus Magnetomonas plexicatena]|uniref:TonB-dependent receptor n=1 Tax=Candidatus Magnetomonas plexicatena TaxID=2552947 RepID=UPI001C75B5D6|nr:TonB-dependent receptor [Nitrospirales bacterium LBB_01]